MTAQPWKDKSAIICGASAGLGLDLARELARQSPRRLVLAARNAQRLERAVEQLRLEFPGVHVEIKSLDLCDAPAVAAWAEQLKASVKQLPVDAADDVANNPRPAFDLLIQAVGQSDRGRFLDLTKSRLDELLDLNVHSTRNAIQYLTAALKQPGGTLVCIGSLACRFAPRYLGGYAIAKHALAALATQARLELAESGVHVMLACPGPIRRDDAGQRYAAQALSQASEKGPNAAIPAAALQPGGGARLKGLDPQQLARDILRAAGRRQPEIIRPRKARLLLILSALSPTLGDRFLRNRTS